MSVREKREGEVAILKVVDARKPACIQNSFNFYRTMYPTLHTVPYPSHLAHFEPLGFLFLALLVLLGRPYLGRLVGLLLHMVVSS